MIQRVRGGRGRERGDKSWKEKLQKRGGDEKKWDRMLRG